ncbi:hypothetical protein BH10BAC4_BH10BAC4_03560 [soil metagenome]
MDRTAKPYIEIRLAVLNFACVIDAKLKSLLSLLGFLLISIIGNSQVSVEIKYSPEKAHGPKIFTTPLPDGKFLFGKRFEAVPDPDGIIHLKIDLKKPGFLYTFTDAGFLSIYLEPGKTINIEIGDDIRFSGQLKKENAYLYNFRRKYGKNGYAEFETKLAKTTSREAFIDSLNTTIDSDIKRTNVTNTLNPEENATFESIKEFIVLDSKLFYYSHAFWAISDKIELSKRNGTYDSAMLSYWDNVRVKLVDKDLINCNLTGSSWYSEYLFNYMGYLWTKNGGKYTTASESTTRSTSLANQYLSGIPKETYISHYLSFFTIAGQAFKTPELLALYNQFKKEFPKSSAIPLLEPKMRDVAKYASTDAPTSA